MNRLTLILPSLLLLQLNVHAQEDSKLELVRRHAKKSDTIFESVSAKYRFIKRVSPKLVEESERKPRMLSVRQSTLDGIWFRDRYSTKRVVHSKMGDGSEVDHTYVNAFNGEKTYQNQDYKNGAILTVRAPDNLFNPRFAGAPIFLGRLGTMEQILDFKLKNAPFGSVTRYWKESRYRHLGEEKVGDLDCHKIELSRLAPDPPGRVLHRSVLWIAPERNWQIIASRNFVLESRSEPHSIARVVEWKEVKPGVWIPSKAETRYFGQDKEGNRIEKRKETFQLVSCNLKCDPDDKRINDVDFKPKMRVQILDPIINTAKVLPIK